MASEYIVFFIRTLKKISTFFKGIFTNFSTFFKGIFAKLSTFFKGIPLAKGNLSYSITQFFYHFLSQILLDFLSEFLVEFKEPCHALALGHGDGEAIDLHNGTVILLMCFTKFGRHSQLIVQVGKAAVGI